MQKFTVTEQHVKLLQASYTSWNDLEYGAASIDPKYPYGNSWFYGSMAEALGLPMPLTDDGDIDDYGEFPDDAQALMDKLHKEMETVLQILLDNAATGISPGHYQADGVKGWVRA